METPLVEKQDVERKAQRVSDALLISGWLGFIISLVSIAVIAAVLFTSTTLSQDKKVFFSSILGICTLGLLAAVILVRRDPIALLFGTQFLGFISALGLGLSITYAS